MCRWLAYQGKPIFLEKLVFEPKYSLIDQSVCARKSKMTLNGDGFGLGWYGDKPEPGQYREVIPAWNDDNLKNLSQQLKSRLFFAHVRASTGTAINRCNCHPFKFKNWLFMHNGQIGGYGQLKQCLDFAIPANLYPYRTGSTDSELLFMLLLKYRLNSDPHRAFIQTIEYVRAVMIDKNITEPFRMTAICSDGNSLNAIRYSSDDKAPSLFYRCHEDGVVVTSEPLDENFSHWQEVAPNSFLSINQGNKIHLQQLVG